MNIVLGLEYRGDSDALALSRRLRFDHAVYHLTHVIPTLSWANAGIYSGYSPEMMLAYGDVLEIERKKEEDARTMLKSFAETVGPKEGPCATHIWHGSPTEALMQHADEIHADLLVVNAAHQGPILAFLSGSVARGLVSGSKQSVLLARSGSEGDTDIEEPVRAVLATDHSPYMDRCIERFLRFRPRGLEHLTVLTAYPEDDLEELKEYVPNLAISPSEAVRRDLEKRNRSLVRRLEEAFHPGAVTVTSRVSGEPVGRAIKHAMEESRAELLIVGAQGHSFLERLTLGSVSFRQAMTAPYSVLVLRADAAAVAEIRSAREPAKSPRLAALAT